jgi:hypothetical protein
MLKDIIEEAQEKAINKLAQYLPDNHKVEEAYQSLDLVIAQTAQIVAREVIRKVREGVQFKVDTTPSQSDWYLEMVAQTDGFNKSSRAILTHLQSLENELEKSDETIPDIPGFEGTREDLAKISIN